MNFKERFEIYSNWQLLRIVENPEDFQPKAVETAESILLNRNLTEEEIKIAKDKLELEKLQKLENDQKKKEYMGKVNKVWEFILGIVSPKQIENSEANKTITIISLIFGGIFIFELISRFSILSYLLSERLALLLDFSVLSFIYPILVLPIASFLFYKRNRLGWII